MIRTLGYVLFRLIIASLFLLGLTLIIVGAVQGLVTAAKADTVRTIICSSWARLKPEFERRHGEKTIGLGVTRDGKARVEVLASGDGRTFSVFLVYPEGIGCLIASGRDWDRLPFPNAPATKAPDDET